MGIDYPVYLCTQCGLQSVTHLSFRKRCRRTLKMQMARKVKFTKLVRRLQKGNEGQRQRAKKILEFDGLVDKPVFSKADREWEP